MLKVIIISLLTVLSIFFGMFPASKNSPHNNIANYLGYNVELHYSIYILIGVIFYVLATFFAQLKEINIFWK